MYSTLIKKLYSNPIQSVIRELSCNAYDAHVEAGNDAPFDVKIPDHNDKLFYIRDYGTGMSKEKINQIYTVIGESDKRNSNEFIGQYGLGSKSPFAVTDSFTVESFYKGTHYLYQMFMDDSNIPSYTLISENPTSEPDGLKISFIVKDSVYDWPTAALCVYSYFKVKPNILGSSLVIPDREYKISGNKWGMLESGWNNRINAIMGNVGYQLNLDMLANFPEHLKYLFLESIDLYFDIGELSVTPSRESLEYNKRTLLHIQARFEEVHKEILSQIHKDLDECPNLLEARIKYFQICKAFRKTTSFDIKYKNQKLDSYISVKDFDCIRDMRYKPAREIYLHIKPDFYVYEKKGDVKRFRSAKNYNSFLLQFKDDKQKKEFLEHVGCDESYLLSCDTIPVACNNTQSRQKTYKISEFDRHFFIWEESNIDINKGGFYIPTYRYNALYDSKDVKTQLNAHKVNHIIEFLNNNNIKIDKLIGIKRAYEKEFEESKKWRNVIDVVKEVLKSKEKINFKIKPRCLVSSFFIKNIPNHKIVQLFKDTNVVTINEILQIEKIANYINYPIQLNKLDLNDEIEREAAKYPLIDFKVLYDDQNSHIIKYITAVDKGVI